MHPLILAIILIALIVLVIALALMFTILAILNVAAARLAEDDDVITLSEAELHEASENDEAWQAEHQDPLLNTSH